MKICHTKLKLHGKLAPQGKICNQKQPYFWVKNLSTREHDPARCGQDQVKKEQDQVKIVHDRVPSI